MTMQKSLEATVSRRHALRLGAAVVGAALFCAIPALAGTYLTSAGLLVTEARRESEVLRKRLHDVELARLVHKLADGRLQVARGMHVPSEVAQAHPHLILVLEAYERAAEAATKKEYKRFLVLLSRAREEEANFRAILKQLGWELPKMD
jgi:hypothetical protein